MIRIVRWPAIVHRPRPDSWKNKGFRYCSGPTRSAVSHATHSGWFWYRKVEA